MSSDETISPAFNNDFIYTFNGLATNTSYNVIVTVIKDNNTSDFQEFSQLIKTRSFSSKFTNKAIYFIECFSF